MKVLTSNFYLSDREDKTSGPLNRVGMGGLTLLKTLLEISQKSNEPSFW